MVRRGTALVAGGSIAGLFAATALLRAGWSVQVFERGATELAGRGAGIVTHRELYEALEAVGAPTDDLGVMVEDRIAVDIAGTELKRIAYPQVVTSWDRIHQILRAMVPEGVYHLGRTITGYEQSGSSVIAKFDDGSHQEGDVIIGADGFRSVIRAQLLPQTQPEYSGYIVWRAVTDEAHVSSDIFADFAFFAPNGMQVLGYPIAGVNNDLRAGHRRYNFVWHMAVSKEKLLDMLKGSDGVQYPYSVPPPQIRDDLYKAMMAQADARLPRAFGEIIQRSNQLFFTPIYDFCGPHLAQGRVAVMGDAACVVRPHVGMGVTKAGWDAVTLARLLSAQPAEQAMRAYSDTRLPAARRSFARGRNLGALIFDTDPALNQDGRTHAALDRFLREIAVSTPVTA